MILRALLWTALVASAVFVEAYWFGEPPVVRADVRSIEKHLVGKLIDAAADRRLGTYALALVQDGKIVAEHGDRRLFLVASSRVSIGPRSTKVAPAFDKDSVARPYQRPRLVAAVAPHTSARDLARFAIAFTGNPVLSKDTVRQMLQPQHGTGGSWG